MTARDDAFEAWRRRALDVDILDIALGDIVNAKLRKKSREHIGACPLCGGGSQEKGKRRAPDGFAVNPGKGIFNCRRGGVGGDVIAMVMHTCGVPFHAACELITGEPPPARGSMITDETRQKSEELKAEAAERERQRLEDDNIYRARELRTLSDIYDRARAFAGSSAETYAGVRGLTFPPAGAMSIKCVEAMPYYVDKETIVHRGPAMVAPIVNAGGDFQGLHFTYLDPAREKGKLQLEHEGEPLDAKKSRGSKQGNIVSLCGPIAPVSLVIGEAIEKTIAVYMALGSTGRDLSGTAFWSACDLGNLTGRSAGSVTHPILKSEKTGRPIKVSGGAPDLTAPAIEIPDSVTDLVLLGDSTSDPFTTRLAMARAAVRYARPGRIVRIAWAPDGADFDDLLREARGDENAVAALEMIAGIVDAASPFVDVATIAAPPFVDVPPLSEPELRGIGKAELDAAVALVRAAEHAARTPALSDAAERLGALVAIGALVEAFARVSLEEAASGCGLVRDDGLRAVKKLISDAIKRGKKVPADLAEVRGAASAALRAPHDERRPRGAADDVSLPPNEYASIPSEVDPPASPAASSFFSAAAPEPPAEGGESNVSSQTGVKPDALPSAGGAGSGPPRETEDEDVRHMRLAFFPLTDLGNAERFRERCKGRLKYNTALGWLVWDAKRWSSNGADELVMIAEHETVRSIQDEADIVRESGRRDVLEPRPGARDYAFSTKNDGTEILYSDKIANWGRSSEAVNKLGALSKRGAPYFAIGVEKLDADPMKINVNNGTIVLKRSAVGDYVTFRPHDPDDLITKISPVDYLPNAASPEYDKFLERIQPRIEMRRFLHQWGGYSLTGDVSEQILAFFYGKGGNGKSLLIDCWSLVAGDYGETLPIETFLDQGKTRSGGQATPDLALLPGRRLLRTSEPEKGSKLAESMVKLVTGGEPIQARKLNKDFFRFYPQFKLTISGNYRPTISGTDEGIWRRMRLVPFDVSIPKPERDRHLIDKLRLEASGILNHLLDGVRDWLDNGLIEPDDVLNATAKYRETSDPLGRFLSACIVAAPGQRVQSSVLHSLYEAWCKSSGEKSWSNRGLSMAMDERGYVRAQSNVMWWHDIKLVKAVDDFVDHEGHARTFSKEEIKNETEIEPGDIQI